MKEDIQGSLRPRPFGGDVDRWRSETEQAVRRHHAVSEQPPGGAFAQSAVAVQTVERTDWGWIRWGYPLQSRLQFEAAFPAEVGVFAPGRSTGWRAVPARMVWGRRPAPVLKQFGGAELPAAVSVGRLALVVAVVLLLGPVLGGHLAAGTAVVGAAVAGLALAWGGPAIAAVATRRQVRILDAAAPHAGRVHRLMALQQMIASASSVSEVAELRRAAEIGHRFLWDGAGLVLVAGEEGRGLEVVAEYETAYQRLAVAAAHALEEQGRLEGRLADLDEVARAGGGPQDAYRGTRPARLVEEALPAVVLDEITESLNELAAGLRHAQHAVTRAADPAAHLEEKHHGDR